MARDRRTLDLFDWQPEEPVRRFDEVEVRAASMRGRVAKAVSATLKAAAAEGRNREAVAATMSEWLGEKVSAAMLNAYASEQREDHSISVVRLAALLLATGDVRLLQMLAEVTGHAVVEARFLPWIEVGQIADRKAELDRLYETARRGARKGRP